MRRRPRARGSTYLLHWSEVPERTASLAEIAPALRDLVSWAADIAVVLTQHCPEDQASIERVRRYALASLDGERPRNVEVDDILTTAAALMSAIDLRIGGTIDADADHGTYRIRRVS